MRVKDNVINLWNEFIYPYTLLTGFDKSNNEMLEEFIVYIIDVLQGEGLIETKQEVKNG